MQSAALYELELGQSHRETAGMSQLDRFRLPIHTRNELRTDRQLLLPSMYQELNVPRACDAIHFLPRYGILKPCGQLHLTTARPCVFASQTLGKDSYGRHIVLACTVLWLFNPVFGVIALCLAVAAVRKSKSCVYQNDARRLGKASTIVSIAGIIVSIVIIIAAVSIVLLRGSIDGGDSDVNDVRQQQCSGFNFKGVCYITRRDVRRDPFCHDSLITCCRPYEDFYEKYYCYDL